MPQKTFTAQWLERLPLPEARTEFFDQKVTGLGLRVNLTGLKSWFFMYRAKGDPRKRRLTLGRYPAITLADAREAARQAAVAVDCGEDPGADKQALKAAHTFSELADEYLEKFAKRNKRSWREDERMLRRDILPAWGRRKVHDIARRDVIALLDGIVDRGAPIQANRTLALVRKIFNWAIGRDIVEHNPCLQVKPPQREHQRDRVLTQDEIRALWCAFNEQGPSIGAMFKLRLMTAQRGGEVASMTWRDIDLDNGWWTIPAERSKNRRSHRVPLTAPASALLTELRDHSGDSDWVFPSPTRSGRHIKNVQKAAQRVREASGVTDFVLHDLRRTAASHMTSIGISRLVVSKILNHVEQGITRVYDRYSYDGEKKQALDEWGDHLMKIVG